MIKLLRLKQLVSQGIPSGFYNKLSWQYASALCTVAGGFVYSLWLGRVLGAYEFGLMALGLSIANIVFSLFELRLQEAVIRYVAEFNEAGDASRTLATIKLSFIADVITGLIALTVVAILSPIATDYLIKDVQGREVLILSGVSVFFSNVATATASGVIRIWGKIKIQSLIAIASISLKIILTLVVVHALHWRILGVIGVAIVTTFLCNFCLITVAFIELKHHLPLSFKNTGIGLLRPRMAEMAKFTLSTYLLSLAGITTKELDVALLGRFTSIEVVGLYRIAKNFMLAMWMIADPIFIVVYPEIAIVWQRRDWGMLTRFINRLSVIMGLTGGLLFAVSVWLVPYTITALMSDQFVTSGTIFRYMVWGIIFWFPFLWLNPLLMAAGRPDITLKAALVESLIITLMYIIFIPRWGGVGAAFVYALANPIIIIVGLYLGHRSGVFRELSGRAI